MDRWGFEPRPKWRCHPQNFPFFIYNLVLIINEPLIIRPVGREFIKLHPTSLTYDITMSKEEEKGKNPAFHSAVFFVADINKSKQFYSDLLGQKIIMDFGRNVGFEGGLAIWERNYAVNMIFGENANNIDVGKNNAEIYFEYLALDELFQRITEEKVRVIHPILEQPWGQRAFRIYDPDNHIIEFAEPMSNVVLRFRESGMKLEEIAKKSLMPIEFIKMVLQNK